MFLTEFPSFHSIEKDIQDFNTIMNNYISKDEKTNLTYYAVEENDFDPVEMLRLYIDSKSIGCLAIHRGPYLAWVSHNDKKYIVATIFMILVDTNAIERQEPAIVVQDCNVYYSEDFLKKKGVLPK